MKTKPIQVSWYDDPHLLGKHKKAAKAKARMVKKSRNVNYAKAKR